MYFVQGPPGSSRERVKMKIDLVSIKLGNFHDSRMSHNYSHLFNYYRIRCVHMLLITVEYPMITFIYSITAELGLYLYMIFMTVQCPMITFIFNYYS